MRLLIAMCLALVAMVAIAGAFFGFWWLTNNLKIVPAFFLLMFLAFTILIYEP